MLAMGRVLILIPLEESHWDEYHRGSQTKPCENFSVAVTSCGRSLQKEERKARMSQPHLPRGLNCEGNRSGRGCFWGQGGGGVGWAGRTSGCQVGLTMSQPGPWGTPEQRFPLREVPRWQEVAEPQHRLGAAGRSIASAQRLGHI